MVSSIKEVKKYCFISEKEEELLNSHQCPIVLMKRKENTDISSVIAPNLSYLGVMVPYTPLHHILLNEVDFPLVMTSGNISEEPIAKDNDEALRRLNTIADYFLMHNRDIYSRYDDRVDALAIGLSYLSTNLAISERVVRREYDEKLWEQELESVINSHSFVKYGHKHQGTNYGNGLNKRSRGGYNGGGGSNFGNAFRRK